MINSRDIKDLHPYVQGLAKKVIADAKKIGIEILITSTYRDAEYQNWLYKQGRTRKGKIVTYAKGGESWHNFRLAFDFVVLRNGKVDWGDMKSYQKVRAIAKKHGLEGLSFELAHLQARGGLTLAQANAGAQPKFA